MHELDDDRRAVAAAVDSLCADFDDGYWSSCDRGHRFPSEFYAAMAAAGWVGIVIPTEYGGAGADITDAALVLNRVAASGAAMNGSSALHLTMFGLDPVVRFGNECLRSTLPASRRHRGAPCGVRRDRGRRRHGHQPRLHARGRAALGRFRHDGPQDLDAKYLAADAASEAADAAVQTLGGRGYATEHHVERSWREARLQRLAPVSQEMTANFIAQNVLGLPRSY